MKTLLVLLFVAALSAQLGCKKDTNDTTPPAGGACKEIVVSNSSTISGRQGLDATLRFDNQGRLTWITNAYPISLRNDQTITYYSNGTANYPGVGLYYNAQKKLTSLSHSNGFNRDTLKFNADGQLIQYSYFSEYEADWQFVYRYAYDANSDAVRIDGEGKKDDGSSAKYTLTMSYLTDQPALFKADPLLAMFTGYWSFLPSTNRHLLKRQELISVVSEAGKTTTVNTTRDYQYTFDGSNRVSQLTWTNSAGTPAPVYHIAYNCN